MHDLPPAPAPRPASTTPPPTPIATSTMLAPRSTPSTPGGPSIVTLVVPDPEAPQPRRSAVDARATTDSKAAIAPLPVPPPSARLPRARRNEQRCHDCCHMHLLAAALALAVGAVVLVFLVVAAMRAKGEPVDGAPPPSHWVEWDNSHCGTRGSEDCIERARLATAGILPRAVHGASSRAGIDGIALLDAKDPTRPIMRNQGPHLAVTRERWVTDAAESLPVAELTGRPRHAATRFDGGTGPRRA
ncbi:hypothetical protein AMAG_08462 [Allomyces macrogynus ATCC 38327]|uniref:Uncharacterized protein n=1 Tax=Allomyces macrogynus (strain ATCC 38327) TaxID=578462 RepID=A0A0L0SLJ7_ALLM3|nr:hypothetical protein AMAG_08462 [Allomyces macrogynus ATCC 38327]|eukprot:KNE63323.1 hypothetical protein AMAG_08462 [Allomyces macrogynus ATCC 38327]